MPSPRDLNEQRMRRIAKRWRRDQSPFFESIDLFPPGKEDRVVGSFYSNHYPERIGEARIELRLRLNGDMNLTYVEEWPESRWKCRWDVHENSHNHDEHFHVPPTPARENAVDVSYPSIPEGVITVAFSLIEDRVGDLWNAATTYPSEYEFDWEYGMDIRR